MKSEEKKKNTGRRLFIILVASALSIKVFSLYPGLVERYYSHGLYPAIAACQRFLFGWVPFSIGDLLYAAVVLWLIIKTVKLIRKTRSKEKINLRGLSLGLCNGLLIVYTSFNLLWGLNYNRMPIGRQLHLNTLDYSDKDLIELTGRLVAKLNQLQASSELHRSRLKKKPTLFDGAISSYARLEKAGGPFAYPIPSIKPSLYSYPGNYLGFTGYYNPFTGEAQVNTTVPLFIQPFTACHEIGHQLGYAKESEANFAGYLAASASQDAAFLYSVYFDMYAYASRYLYASDSLALKEINGQISLAVKKDINRLRAFLQRYSTPVETAIDNLYAQYLKANEQPSGKMSYNEVVALLIAYYKKEGHL